MRATLQRSVNHAVLIFALALKPFATFAATGIEGRVEGGGKPITEAEVTLWLAGPGAPQKLAATKTKNDGSFALTGSSKAGVGVLYLIADGDSAVPAVTGVPDDDR